MMLRRPVRRLIALLVLVGSWTPAIASIVIAWSFDLPKEPVPGAFLSASPLIVQSRFDDIGVTVALIYGALSAVLIARRPHPVAIVTSIHALGSGLAAFGVQWGLLGEQVPGLPLWGLLLHAAGWGYVPGTVGTTIVPLLLLRAPRVPGQRVLIGLGIALAAIATFPALTHQAAGAPANPLAIQNAEYQAALPVIYGIAVVVALALSLVVAVMLVVRWAGNPPEGRRRLGWLVVGHAFLTLSYAALVIPASVAVPTWVWDFGMIAPVVGQLFYPSAVLVLVLGPRLRGIDIAVSRVLVWSILTVIAVTAYLVVVGGLGAFLPWPQEVVGIVAAAAVGVALLPLRDWLQRRVDRLIWDDGEDPDELVRRLGERVGELESGAQGLEELVEALRGAARLGWAEIRSLPPGTERAASGAPNATTEEIELRAGGDAVGVLEIAPRRGERISRRTRRELHELAAIVAVALRLAQAGTSLEHARDSVLAMRSEERRALRRELHDGLGPALAGIGFGLAAADRLLDSDPPAARDLIIRLSEDLRSRVREIRNLVRTMRSEDAELDLRAELEELARDFSTAGPDIRVEAAPASAVPRALRRGVLLIAAEAVHNAVRHADATAITIELRAGITSAELVVTDDGNGFDGGTGSSGVGLTTMRERAAELGATIRIDSAPGAGTTIRVLVPLSVPQEVLA